jgi:predicted enzyme related to lactoylglutathione lyase
MGPRPAENAPVFGYVNIVGVENIDEAIAKIEAAGGTIALAKMEVPGVGWLAYYKDTEGNIFGAMQPHPMAPKQ